MSGETGLRELEVTTDDDPVGVSLPASVIFAPSFFELLFAVSSDASRRAIPKALRDHLLSGDRAEIASATQGADWFSVEVPPTRLHILCGWLEQLAAESLEGGRALDIDGVYRVLTFLREAERHRVTVFVAEVD